MQSKHGLTDKMLLMLFFICCLIPGPVPQAPILYYTHTTLHIRAYCTFLY